MGRQWRGQSTERSALAKAKSLRAVTVLSTKPEVVEQEKVDSVHAPARQQWGQHPSVQSPEARCSRWEYGGPAGLDSHWHSRTVRRDIQRAVSQGGW